MPYAWESFFFLLARLSGLFITAPIFSSRMMPGRVKALIIIMLAATLAYFVPVEYTRNINTPGLFIAALAVETFIGYTIGFVIYAVLATIQLAGQLMDMLMGFSIVNVVDPQSGTQIPLMGNFTQALALLTYLAIDGHHYLLQALAQSYAIVPVMSAHLPGGFLELLVEVGTYIFVVAVKIAAPMLVAILTSDVAMGFIARTVPQMNVFLVGLPLKIFLGLITLLFLLPIYLWVYNVLFAEFFGYLDRIILFMG